MHKYYNAMLGDLKQYVNHNDFTFFDFQLVCEDWSKNIFERPLEDFRLSTNFEVGVNIELTQYKPFDVLAHYMTYVTTSTNEFYTCPPKNLKGKPIQRMCYVSDYKIKGYDKSKQSEIVLKADILRYEVIYTELRKIRSSLGLSKTAEISLQTLNDKQAWHKLFTDIIKMYDAIKKIPLLSEGYHLEDIPKVHAYCNKIMAADFKRNMNINTYNKLRASYKKVYNHYDRLPTNYHMIVRRKMVDKYNSLIIN
jgi:CRISPR/Cas system CSM-associated protein Csm2 small subunit